MKIDLPTPDKNMTKDQLYDYLTRLREMIVYIADQMDRQEE